MSDSEGRGWQLASGEEDMQRLLAEVTRHRGESLWQDAWRRLRRSRVSMVSLFFLLLFALVSLLAPLAPLPSPTAFEQVGIPQPPWWSEALAGGGEPELRAEAMERLEPSSRPTQVLWGGALDDGWRHRAVLTFQVPDSRAVPVRETIGFLVEDVSGRSPALRVEEEEGGLLVHAAVPLRASDGERLEHRPTGRKGRIELLRGVDAAGSRSAALRLEVPVDPAALRGWSVGPSGPRQRVYLELLPGPAAPTGATLAYEYLPPGAPGEASDWQVEALSVNGVPVGHVSGDPSGLGPAAPADPAAWLESLQLPEAALAGEAARIRLEGLDPQLLFERATLPATELRGHLVPGLRGRVASALAAGDLPEGTLLGELLVEEGYTWELTGLDAWLLELRGSLFGLWQLKGWAGTDALGRDLLSRILWGSRTSILVALAATLCSLLIGVTYGATAGLLGGRIDNLLMRVVDMLYSVPFIFVVIFLITLVGEYRTMLEDRYGIDREVVFFVVIGAIYWLTMARVVRGQVLALKSSEFVEAARVVGASTPRILLAHIVPNVLSVVIVYLTLTIPAVMLFEAFLSFLGLGIEPPKVSWGLLASDSTEAISPVRTFWWLVAFPAAAMGGTLLALNVLGDGLRDALDPKLRGEH